MLLLCYIIGLVSIISIAYQIMYSYIYLYINTIIGSVVVRWDDWTTCTKVCGGRGSQYRVKFCDDGTGEVECDRITNPCGNQQCGSYLNTILFAIFIKIRYIFDITILD